MQRSNSDSKHYRLRFLVRDDNSELREVTAILGRGSELWLGPQKVTVIEIAPLSPSVATGGLRTPCGHEIVHDLSEQYNLASESRKKA